MDSNTNILYTAAGLPALISTGITVIYFLLKACCYLVHAISHKTKGRVATATPGSGEQKYSPDTGSQGHTEVHEQISGNTTEQYGGGTQRSPGSVFVPRRRQDICLPSCGDASEYQDQPAFRQNAKRLRGGRYPDSPEYHGKRPGDSYPNPTGVFAKSRSGDNASHGQSSDDETNGRKCNTEQPDKVYDDGVQGSRAPSTPQNSTTTKTQVSHVALQTDLCDTLYITKSALTAYTIAIVQNTQALQYDQMHLALQTARNQASLETPLRADELLTAHFNLAVLSNETDVNKTSDAQKPEATTLDAEPSASAADEETYVKIPSHRYAANSDTKKQHPTGAVVPTCRREYGLVNGILAGYETDDSWDNDSHTHEHTHTHNIVPLLAIRPWNNRPHRGREQSHGQYNNINVRTGHEPYSRPWDNQPYGRRTRSQQALHARAYHKIQRRYPIQ